MPFQAMRRTFAEIDVCPQCAGVFFDPGEGVSTHGADGEAAFLVRDGRARIVRNSPYTCPAGTHEPIGMQVYAVGFGESAIEIDYCPRCTGFFLDCGEGAALAALERGDDTVETSSGARFSAPPKVDRQAEAIAQAQRESSRGLFDVFVVDVLEAAQQGARAMEEAERRRRWRRWGL
ncbi:hypothetical protein DB32_007294 [Sandaracinus amylolyticus]|uniref:Cyclic nucleotide-binding domain-containing protein n=1 Tax=Sandaracinus amylolyticus TaxID=927083 RepID=A0A0F6YN83_9BACT|nr:hypothetical protein DB32_007294 [Sandaracinus amylolyticus]